MRKFLLCCLFVSFYSTSSYSETGEDLSLNPEKYLNKTVNLKGCIDSSSPTLHTDGSGKFFEMRTYTSKRVNTGSVTRNSFQSEGYVKVFVPNDKISSFVSSFKSDTPKGFSGVFKKYTPKEQGSEPDHIEKQDNSFYFVDITPKSHSW
jgi:hypothetical protein